jgi:DNA-binding NarL/FixJ family response regulator
VRAVRSLLDAEDDIVVVGEARTAEEGVRRVGCDEPNVVLRDVRLPDARGSRRAVTSAPRFPDCEGADADLVRGEEALMSAILAGASGYEMFLAEKTVKNYVSNLLAKMGMSQTQRGGRLGRPARRRGGASQRPPGMG